MPNNIGVSLSVDGEAKFKSAMKNAAKAVNDVDSRLKLATAEFKKNGDAQKLMQTRSKTLNEEIKRQTQIVDALDDALKTTEKQYGENSTQALNYEAQLNRARQKLVQMETALENNAQGLDENGRAFEEAGDKAEKAAISFSDVNQAITNVQAAAKNAASYVINFAKSAWNAMSNASEYADNLLTLSAQTGLSVEQLQRYARAAGLVDTEVSAIYTAMARMVNPSGEMADALQQLGVNTREIIGTTDFTGAMKNYVKDTDFADTKARNALDIFWDTIDALKRLSDQGKDVDELTKSIFGKSFLEMKPLIEAGKKGWDEAGESLHNVISDESIENLGKFNDQLGALQSEFNGLKDEILGQLAPSFTDIAKALTDMLVQFGEWAKSESGQKALGNLSDAISNIVKDIGEDDFESLINTATSIIEGLAGAINSITNDPSGIINGVKTALVGYATLSVSKEVLSLLTLLRSLGGSGIASKIDGVFSKLGSLFAPGASAEGAAAATPAAAAGGHRLLAGGNALKTIAGIEAVALTEMAVESVYNTTKELIEHGSILGIGQDNGNGGIDQGGLNFSTSAPKAWLSQTGSLLESYVSWIDENIVTPTIGKENAQNATKKVVGVWNDYVSWIDDNIVDPISELFGGGGTSSEYRDSMTGLTREEIEEMAKLTKSLQMEAENAADETITTYTEELNAAAGEGMSSVEGTLEGAGEAAGNALAAGLLKAIPNITGAVKYIEGIVAQIQAGPATTTAYGVGLGKTGANVTRNNNIYINNLNQSNAADVYDTLRSMDAAQEHLNRGWGYVPV